MKKLPLKEYYKSLGRPQKELIERFVRECGKSKMTIYRWINGTVMPDKQNRNKIAEIIGLPVDVLFPDAKD